MTLRFGVYVPTTGPYANADSLREVTQAAEALGYDSIWTGDHIVIPKGVDFSKYLYGEFPVDMDITNPFFDCVASLAYLAGMTKKVRLCIGILVAPARNAMVLAKELATIDNLSGGRVVLGIGTGWMSEEFTALNLPPGTFDNRGAVTDESMEVYRAMWADGLSSYHGRHYDFDTVAAFPKPAQRPGIPIWVGGNSGPALRRVARLGDGWQGLTLTAAEVKQKNAEIDRLLAEAGRKPTDVTRAVAVHVMQTQPGAPLPVQPSAAMMVGDAASLAAQVNAYAEAGAQELTLNAPAATPAEFIRELESFRRVIERL